VDDDWATGGGRADLVQRPGDLRLGDEQGSLDVAIRPFVGVTHVEDQGRLRV